MPCQPKVNTQKSCQKLLVRFQKNKHKWSVGHRLSMLFNLFDCLKNMTARWRDIFIYVNISETFFFTSAKDWFDFHICEHLVLILHICETWVTILDRCEELVPILHICENWVPILHIWEKSKQSFADGTNTYQFFTVKNEKDVKFELRC